MAAAAQVRVPGTVRGSGVGETGVEGGRGGRGSGVRVSGKGGQGGGCL